MTFATAIGKLFRLSSEERRLMAQSALIVAGVRLSLSLSSLEATLRRSSRLVGASGSKSMDAADIESTVTAVRRASRLIPRASCLTQAIAAKTLLARHGQESTLRLGVAKRNEDVEAHAWLEADGRVLIGQFENQHFAPLK